ncbi:MAG: lipase maturation factor family protein, partial [Deltaproteobacteria bacterium]
MRTHPWMIYDGQCGFCRLWIERWKKITGDAVAYAPFQDVSDQFPTIPEDQFKSSVQFVETDGTIYSGAAAVFKSLSYARRRKWMFWCYKNIPGASFVTESIYQFIANHRPLFSKLTTLFWGKTVEPPTYLFSSWLFIKALAIIYGIAFFSLWIQIRGLIGTDGILPIESFLKAIKGHVGSSAYFWFPTLAWLSPTNFFLDFLSMGGVILSIILFLGFTPTIALWLLWVFYLSLTVAGSEFMQFQWDALLLETGFLSIFLFHSQIRSRWKQFVMPSHLIHFLLRWLLFRLVFSSGVVKLISGDPAWHSFTALNYHYETQPLPTPIAWYVHQLPEWFDKVSCGFM